MYFSQCFVLLYAVLAKKIPISFIFLKSIFLDKKKKQQGCVLCFALNINSELSGFAVFFVLMCVFLLFFILPVVIFCSFVFFSVIVAFSG